MTAQTNVSNLVKAGRFREAAVALDSLSPLAVEQQVLRQFLELHVGRAEVAKARAQDLLVQTASTAERVRCLLIVGKATVMTGGIAEGCRLLREATSEAHRTGDLVLMGCSQALLVRTLLQSVSIESCLAEMPRLRQYAYRAGDASTLIEFHCAVAEMDIKRRRHASAHSHLRTAHVLAERLGNRFLLADVLRLQANAFLLLSSPRQALRPIELSVKYAAETGSSFALVPALSTMAHVQLMIGELELAQRTLERMLELSIADGARIAAYDSLMLVALKKGDIESAGRFADYIADTFPDTDAVSYYYLWHVPTRAEWLLQQRRTDEALALLARRIPDGEATYDSNLIYALRLAEAQAFAADGQTQNAAVALAAGVGCAADLGLENVADLNRIAALIDSVDRPHDGSRSRRASRASAAVNTSLAAWEPTTADDRSAMSRSANAVELVAALFDLAVCPPLAGFEALSLLDNTECAISALLVRIDGNGHRKVIDRIGSVTADVLDAERDTSIVRISMGKADGYQYELLIAPTAAAQPRLTLLDIERLIRSAVSLRDLREKTRELTALWPEDVPEQQLGMVFAAQNMVDLVSVMRRVATSNVTVLLTGETGTGKELLARALHESSSRNGKPFVPFNCTAVARDMLDSQLFGYRRGAFTGAQEAFPGVIRAAAGGTLFLDEIGELGIEVQPKLLRFLESGEIHPLGELRPISVDVRILAATNANLEKLVMEGRFREDLYYRLNVVRLQVPALRERREEVPLLAQHYLEKFSREFQKTGLRLAEETMEYLLLFRWPGNVRQLANEMRRMVALAEFGAVLMPEHLSEEIAASRRTVPPSERDLAPTEFVVRIDQPMSAAVEHLERSMIQYALKLSDGRLEDAARLLGLSRKGLYLKRQRLNIGDEAEIFGKGSATA